MSRPTVRSGGSGGARMGSAAGPVERHPILVDERVRNDLTEDVRGSRLGKE